MKHASVCVFIVRNPYSGHKYLCGAFQSSAMLFEWVEAMQRFMLIKVSERMRNHIKKHKVHPCITLQSCVFVSVQSIDLSLPCPLEVFEMLVVPEQHYPLVCVAVSKGSHPDQVVTFGTVDPNAANPAFTEPGQHQSCTVSQFKIWLGLDCQKECCLWDLCEPLLRCVFPETPQTCVIHVTQLERDTVLVCLDRKSFILIIIIFTFVLCT